MTVDGQALEGQQVGMGSGDSRSLIQAAQATQQTAQATQPTTSDRNSHQTTHSTMQENEHQMPMPKVKEPRIIAVANQKGGVGKTTTTISLGAAAADLGHRVLIVDLDPQGNASTGLGINPRNLDASIYEVLLHDVPLEDAIEAS